jgi:hypothetical protein
VNKKKQPRRCAICGALGAVTDDHLPPQSLYPPPRAPNLQLFSVPACFACNNGANADDEEFKIAIGVMRADLSSSELLDSLSATLSKNGRLHRTVVAGVPTMVFDGGTLRRGPVRITFDRKRYNNVVARMVKGLYWHETRTCLGRDTVVDVVDQGSLTQETEAKFRSVLLLPELERRTLNAESIVYKFFVTPAGESFWAFWFFGSHAVFAAAGAPAGLGT